MFPGLRRLLVLAGPYSYLLACWDLRRLLLKRLVTCWSGSEHALSSSHQLVMGGSGCAAASFRVWVR